MLPFTKGSDVGGFAVLFSLYLLLTSRIESVYHRVKSWISENYPLSCSVIRTLIKSFGGKLIFLKGHRITVRFYVFPVFENGSLAWGLICFHAGS